MQYLITKVENMKKKKKKVSTECKEVITKHGNQTALARSGPKLL